MSIRSVVTRGYGNGSFSGSVNLVAVRGFGAEASSITGYTPDRPVTTKTHLWLEQVRSADPITDAQDPPTAYVFGGNRRAFKNKKNPYS